MLYVDLSQPFSPAMIWKFRRRGEDVYYAHPGGLGEALRTVRVCGLPDATVLPDVTALPVCAEPLPQFEKPLPQHWQHMAPGPARDAAMAADGINSHNAQRARRRGVLRHKSVGC